MMTNTMGEIIIVKNDEYNILVSENDALRKKCASLVKHLIAARDAGYYDYEPFLSGNQ